MNPFADLAVLRVRWYLALATCLAGSLAAPGASALSCTPEPGDISEGAPFLCAATFSRARFEGDPNLGENRTINGVEYRNRVGGVADNSSSAPGSLAGSALAQADWGLLRAFASADNGDMTDPDPFNESSVISMAEAAATDGAVVAPALPTGTPVEIRTILEVSGAFSNGAGGAAELNVIKLNDPFWGVLTRQAILNSFGSVVPEPFVLPDVFAGDTLVYKFEINVAAGSTNAVVPVRTSAAGDMSGTGRLFFEVLTPGASLETLSGHDYTKVPDPPLAAVLGAAALLLARLRRADRHASEMPPR